MELNPSNWHHIPDISCYNHNWYRMNIESWRNSPVYNPNNYSDDFWSVCAPFVLEECDDDNGFTYSLFNSLSDFESRRSVYLGELMGDSGLFDDEYAGRTIDTDEVLYQE